MGNKTGLITPFFMLLAGAIASIIMYVRGFDLTTMLWGAADRAGGVLHHWGYRTLSLCIDQAPHYTYRRS